MCRGLEMEAGMALMCFASRVSARERWGSVQKEMKKGRKKFQNVQNAERFGFFYSQQQGEVRGQECMEMREGTLETLVVMFASAWMHWGVKEKALKVGEKNCFFLTLPKFHDDAFWLILGLFFLTNRNA